MKRELSKEYSRISSMFNSISGKYDFLNHLLSFGIDKTWRNKLVRRLKNIPSRSKVLDIGCGTGDLTIALYKAGFETVGLDIADKMLKIAQKKSSCLNKKDIPNPQFFEGNAENLPFGDFVFDAVTISFGIRNFDDREKALKEIFRVLKKNGKLAILEFSEPKNRLWRNLYKIYFTGLLPFIGRLISKDTEAYKYLPDSVRDFPQYEDFCNEISMTGFSNIIYKPLTGGIATLYIADKLG
ncbi:MAG: bifunctional demethylmenaquinone methyltransferase/2-methoxy-6-polyprenyl-1,4-benzoquinol methylase UbiE [Rikenellaceae bacterium]